MTFNEWWDEHKDEVCKEANKYLLTISGAPKEDILRQIALQAWMAGHDYAIDCIKTGGLV
jgi:hypothetical protein